MYEAAVRGTAAAAPAVEKVEAAIRTALADPLLIFLAGPVTGSTVDQANELMDMIAPLKSGPMPFEVHVYSAPEEADPRIHSDFADHACWRQHDEVWIRHSDLVVILHTRPATGLGCVNDIARAASVPVMVFSDTRVTPMIRRTVPAAQRGRQAHAPSMVRAFLAENEPTLLARRELFRRAAQESWRPGRLSLQRIITRLSNRGLASAVPTTITRQRLAEVRHDDYAFGSVTDFERVQLRALVAGAPLPPLHESAHRALAQASRNARAGGRPWTPEQLDYLETIGRELIADSGLGNQLAEVHYKSPNTPRFWSQLYDSVFG
jgi:hypothetical protein